MTTSLQLLALQLAQAELGVTETGGNNRGPRVEMYQRSGGGWPGDPWCTFGLFWCFAEAAQRLGLRNPFPRTGKALALWERAPEVCRDSNPAPGRVYVLRHAGGKGHVGIAEALDEDAATLRSEISFNTNAAGSREGNTVARHLGTPEVSHGGELLGWLDFDRLVRVAAT